MDLSISDYMQGVGAAAKKASLRLAMATTKQKNSALLNIADLIDLHRTTLIEANAKDLAAGQVSGLSESLMDRLALTEERLTSMADGLRQIVNLADPVGLVSDFTQSSSGLQIGKMRVPLGVIGIIYESRPNVTADAAALCLKSGNAAILRGGSEAIHSNQAIARLLSEGLSQAGLPAEAIQLVATTDRAAVGEMLTANGAIDVIIPRGGRSLIERVARDATVPVIKHLDGVCHVYVDDQANTDKAIAVAFNSKTYRYGICGAMESLLVARSRVDDVLKPLISQFLDHGVELRACPEGCALDQRIKLATDEDWDTEYLAGILSIKVVEGIEEAIAHIGQYGSGHTDSICTDSLTKADLFQRAVDSSSVMVNAATCFADGYEYGLGAEIGISTDRLHVRGPVGLEGLTIQKYIVKGDGAVRS